MRLKRLEQVEEALRDVVADELTRWDFRSTVVSVTRTVVSPDLSRARVFVSILAEESEAQRAWKRLQGGVRILQRRVGREMRLRRTPVIALEWDKSIEKGARVLDIMKRLAEEEGRAGRGDNAEEDSPDAEREGRIIER